MLSVTAQGNIAASRRLEEGALDLEGELVVPDTGGAGHGPALRPSIRPPTALRHFRVSGTVSRPILE